MSTSDYMVVCEATHKELETVVKSYLAIGWGLQGGVAVATYRDVGGLVSFRLYQALAKSSEAGSSGPEPTPPASGS